MRFCPFCSAENQHESSECGSCGRRLPPLPPRRRKNGLERTAPVAIARVESPHPASDAGGTTELVSVNPVENLSPVVPVLVVASDKVAKPPTVNSGIPIPSRTERDRLAALSSGVAPSLAKERVSSPDAVEESNRLKEMEPDNSTEAVDSGWPAPATSAAPNSDEWSLNAPAIPPAAALKPASAPAIPAAAANSASAAVSMPGQEVTSSQGAPGNTTSSTSSSSAYWPVPEQPIEKLKPFKAPDVIAIPGVPEAGLLAAMKYTVAFGRARWQRRGAIKSLRSQIGLDTGVLDGILGTLGKQARSLKIETTALQSENRAIDEAEKRRRTADHDCSGLSNRQAEENSKFADIESERNRKVDESAKALEGAQGELGSLEAQRRGWRDKRKGLESRKKGYLKAADNRSSEAEKQEITSQRDELRHSAESLRSDAAALDSECEEVDKCLRTLEEPISEKTARVDALRSDLDAAKRALTDLREGHRHRLAEIDAEQGRKSRELAQAEAEIQRRMVTLGTIVNLNRIDRGEFADLYAQIDTLRGAIGARSNAIDKLSAERHAFDKASLVRGACVLGGIVIVFLALLAILFSG